MRRLFVIFLLLIQSFILCVNAQEINFSAPKLNNHIQYIQTQTTPQKKISVDFKNYENAVLSLSSKTENIFAYKCSGNIDGIFLGFSNSDFINKIAKYSVTTNNIYSESHNISSYLKNEILVRAP